jgi:hypothetical protein
MFAGVSSNIPLLLIASEMYVKCDMALKYGKENV